MRTSVPLLLLCAGLAGCAGVNRSLDKGTGALGELLLPLSQEIQLGNQLAQDINQQEKILEDPQVQAYVQKVGQRIAKAAKDSPKEIRYQFTVIDQPKVINAFALPGGHIYVYSGLILASQTEAELAAVLGHEVGHVTSRHAAQSLGTAYGLEALAAVALGEQPGTVTQIAAGIAAQGYMSRHSRDAEREADTKGLDYLIAAGYDPNAMPRFFQELAKISGSSNVVADFFASHPNPGERSKNLSQAIRRKGNPSGAASIVGDLGQIQARLRGQATSPSTGTTSGAKNVTSGSKSGANIKPASSGGAPVPAPAPSPTPAR